MNTHRFSLISSILVITIVSIGAGCLKSEDISQKSIPTVTKNDQPLEQDSKHPDILQILNCSKKELFDPLVQQCVNVDDDATRNYILNKYKYLAEIVNGKYKKRDDVNATTPVEVRILLANYYHRDKFFTILNDLPIKSIHGLIIQAGKQSLATGGFSEFTEGVALQDVDKKLISLHLAREEWGRGSREKIDRESEEKINQELYTISEIYVMAQPTDLLEWWTKHWDVIRVIEPRHTKFDQASFGLSCPTCEFRPSVNIRRKDDK